MEYIKAMGIDQSLNASGIVHLKSGQIVSTRCIKPVGKDDSMMERVNHTYEIIMNEIEVNNPDYIQLEGLSYGSKGDVVYKLANLQGCVMLALYKSGYREATADLLKLGSKKIYTVVPPSRMKSFNLADGNSKKDSGYLLRVMQKVGKTFDDDNIADAYMHAMMISIVSQVMSGKVDISGLPEWQQECLIKNGVKNRKGLSLAKALKLPSEEKLKLAETFLD